MTTNHQIEITTRLTALGISIDHAKALRRIAMTLQRWFELECGDRDNFASRSIVRGHKRYGKSSGLSHDKNGVFEYDDTGAPYMEVHYHRHDASDPFPSYYPVPDRETGARKRLAKIMTHYPELSYYVQTDPRGAALYVGKDLTNANYSHGVAVYK